MRIVWLIRHGESESNANLPTTHPAASALTGKGEAQARAVVSVFERRQDLVVVSPYLRAGQTAVPTLNHFHPIPTEEWPVHEFTYLSPIHYDGKRMDYRRPLAKAYWELSDPDHKNEGEGESFNEMMQRVRTTITRLQNHEAPFIALFSHSLFIRAILLALITDSTVADADIMRRYRHFLWATQTPNGSITKLYILPNGEILSSRPQTSHL